MSRWWRAYDEAVDDPKLLLLTDKQHRTWFNLMCVASVYGGVLPDIKVVAVKLRMTPAKAQAAIDDLKAAILIDDVDGVMQPHNWNGRQYKSDVTDPTNAMRQQRYRDRHRNGPVTVTETVTVTPPRVQNTETDSETDKTPSLRSGVPRARGTRLPADWCPSQQHVDYAISKGFDIERIGPIAEKFRNHWTSKAGKDACKVDWDRTWENWILNETERRHGQPRQQQTPPNGGDLARQLAAEVREREREAGLFGPPDVVRGH